MPASPAPDRMRFLKAQKLHWHADAIDLTDDAAQWATFSERERDSILRACAMFFAGEQAVATDLVPLLAALRRRGGYDDACTFLISQLWDEARHVAFFERWLHTVTGSAPPPLADAPNHALLFGTLLPTALDRLDTDTSPEALVAAVTTYHVIVEGMLAESGYHGFYRCFRERGVLPGLVAGIELVQRDEARHIAFGLDLLGTWLDDAPALRAVFDREAGTLVPTVLGVLADYFVPYGDANPFGLTMTEVLDEASRQFSRRLAALPALPIAQPIPS